MCVCVCGGKDREAHLSFSQIAKDDTAGGGRGGEVVCASPRLSDLS